MREAVLQQKIRAVFSAPGTGVRVFRNNVGQLPGASGYPVKFGLAVGSADLIGIVSPSGRFLAVEVKTASGTVKPEQIAWLQMVRDHGGLAFVCRSVEQAETILRSLQHADS